MAFAEPVTLRGQHVLLEPLAPAHAAEAHAAAQDGEIWKHWYTTVPAPDKAGAGHPGGRIAFLPDETLLLSIGEGFDYRDQAQALGSDLGKIVRLDREGRPPADNPLADTAGARPELYTVGHRNPQGLLVDPRDGTVWEHEHGPKGGDEINRIRPGLNYGWPLTTFGVDYSGELVSTKQKAQGIETPVLVMPKT